MALFGIFPLFATGFDCFVIFLHDKDKPLTLTKRQYFKMVQIEVICRRQNKIS